MPMHVATGQDVYCDICEKQDVCTEVKRGGWVFQTIPPGWYVGPHGQVACSLDCVNKAFGELTEAP